MFSILKRPWVIAAIVIVAGGSVTAFYYKKQTKAPSYNTATVRRTDLVEEVEVTGLVKPVEEINLAFESAGKVTSVAAGIGDIVQAGQVIATIDSSELAAQLSSAKAATLSAQSVYNEYQTALAAEQARLDEMLQGTRPEEIAVAQTEVDNAKQTLADAQARQSVTLSKGDQDLQNLYSGSSDITRDAYTKADDAVHKYTDDMFSKDFINRNELDFVVSDATAKADTEAARGVAFTAVDAIADTVVHPPATQQGIDQALAQTISNLDAVQNFLIELNQALNVSVGVNSTVLTTYKSNVSTARTNINAAIADVNARIQAIAAQKLTNEQNKVAAQNDVSQAQSALNLAESQLALKKAGSVPEQIRAQEAKVQQAKLTLSSQLARVQQAKAEEQRINAQLSNFVIVAPIDGIVTKQDAKLGQIVSAGSVLSTIISKAAFEITANVPEADIAKIHLNDPADLTLDAYGDDIAFQAHVTSIDPAQTIVEGVTTYKVTFQFNEEDDRIKSGMTANLTVVTGTRRQVLAIPQRAVALKNGKRYAQVVTNGQVDELEIKTGLNSQDGLTEILSGLSEGQEVITSARIE